jgi:hypothetical protein
MQTLAKPFRVRGAPVQPCSWLTRALRHPRDGEGREDEE